MKYNDLHVNEAPKENVLTFIFASSHGNKKPQRPFLFFGASPGNVLYP